MSKNKRIVIISVILTVLLLCSTIIMLCFFCGKDKNDSNIKVKDNVNVITAETEMQPINITEDTLVFNSNPGYEVGDVIVAGIIDKAPNGFVRKVVKVSEVDDVIEYKTQYAVLTDVFEEAHIVKTFAVTDEEVRDVDEINNAVMKLELESSNVAVVQSFDYSQLVKPNAQKTAAIEIEPSENGLGVVVELDETFGESLEISGKVEVNTYLEIKIDIEDGEVDFGMAVHTDTSGELFAGYHEELFDKNDRDNDGEETKELIKKTLPSFEFFIGPVPVVITNDFKLSAEVSAQVEGQIGTTVGVSAERVSGFEYSSETGTIEEINEKKYLSDGIEWETEAKANGELEVGIYVHLITKLYGSTGTDLSVGIAGDIKGELALGVDEKLLPQLYGKLALSIGPKAKGKILVTVPVIDYELLETEILKVTFPAFWEKEWEVPDPMLIALQKGNFSCFSGKYVATLEDNNNYGGGQNLIPLKLKKEGILSGGGTYSHKSPYPKTKPISVSKNEDGSYKCVWETGTIYDPEFPNEEGTPYESYYTIYPVGVIEDNEYVRENHSYLKDVVYIHCVKVDGGVMDIIYYDDSIANIVLDYDGEDWVSQETYTGEVGQNLISGTGVKYKVVALENNFDAGGGRERIVLETNDGKRWMIQNYPAFEYDMRTGIIYFNIYEYESNSDYVEDNSLLN